MSGGVPSSLCHGTSGSVSGMPGCRHGSASSRDRQCHVASCSTIIIRSARGQGLPLGLAFLCGSAKLPVQSATGSERPAVVPQWHYFHCGQCRSLSALVVSDHARQLADGEVAIALTEVRAPVAPRRTHSESPLAG